MIMMIYDGNVIDDDAAGDADAASVDHDDDECF